MRLLLLFAMTSYTYLFKANGVFGSGLAAGEAVSGATRSAGDLLRNNLVFASGFVEVSLWFWVFVLLRDERRLMAAKLAERRHEALGLYGKEL